MSDRSNSEEISITSGLKGKKILLVDDDVRNVFALSSILETGGMEVIFAENGMESLELLQKIGYRFSTNGYYDACDGWI